MKGTLTQRERVKMMLEQAPSGVCSTVFLSMRLPRAAARVAELRSEGLEIVTERCDDHFHRTRQIKYRIVPAGKLF